MNFRIDQDSLRVVMVILKMILYASFAIAIINALWCLVGCFDPGKKTLHLIGYPYKPYGVVISATLQAFGVVVPIVPLLLYRALSLKGFMIIVSICIVISVVPLLFWHFGYLGESFYHDPEADKYNSVDLEFIIWGVFNYLGVFLVFVLNRLRLKFENEVVAGKHTLSLIRHRQFISRIANEDLRNDDGISKR